MLTTRTIGSPIGPLRLLATESALAGVYFEDHRGRPSPAGSCERPGMGGKPHPVLAKAEAELGEFFAGDRQEFSVPLAPRGTPFQLRVWAMLRAIPFGETCSYAELAAAAGAPKAQRAAGTANGANPLSILVPCHRVIGARGALTGYAGGLERKRWLLDHEARWLVSNGS